MPKNFVGEPFCAVFHKISGSEKYCGQEGWGWVSRFSVENFLSHSAEKMRRGTSLCLTEFLVSKKFMEKRGGGEPRFTVEHFLSHSAEKFLHGTRRCFAKIPFSKNVRDKRGCHSLFSVENIFVSQCRKES